MMTSRWGHFKSILSEGFVGLVGPDAPTFVGPGMNDEKDFPALLPQAPLVPLEPSLQEIFSLTA